MTQPTTNTQQTGWVERLAPAPMRPWLHLARADKPAGFWLLMWPCWWATALAAGGWPDLRLLALFLVGAIVMRSAGCTINDIMDRDIDARVARTRDRPLASGAISLSPDLTLLPTPTGPVAAAAGETWHFQAWYRDALAGSATSNFTDGVALTWQ